MSKSYSPAQYAPVETRNLKHSPNCHFYVNGDMFFPGSRLCISNRIRTFDGVKDELTKALFKNSQQPGHVRNIYTPSGGSRICSLDDLRDGEHYVAALNDKFKPLPYQDLAALPRIAHKGRYKKIDYNRRYAPVQHAVEERLRNKSGKCKYLNDRVRGLRLRVHVNGANERPAIPVSVMSKFKENMEKIKERIEESLNLQPIEKIYKIINMGGHIENFEEVVDPSEFDSDEHILVLTKNRKHLDPLVYRLSGKQNLKVPTSPHAGNWYLYPAFPNLTNGRGTQYRHNNSLNKHRPLPSIGSSSKQSDPMSPYSNPPSQRSKKSKPQKSVKQTDYDQDPSQVYRAKNQGHARGAQQVNETRETRTERPIDDMEAEVVMEEDIRTQDKASPAPQMNDDRGAPQNDSMMNDSTDRDRGAPQNDSMSKTNEVNKSRKTDKPKVGVLPPEVDDDDRKSDDNVVDSKADKNTEVIEDIQEGQVWANIDHYEGMNEREVTPDDLKSTDLELNKAPLATTPPENKAKTGSSQDKERIDENAVAQDDSFSRYDRNSEEPKKDPRSSTPASSGDARRKQEEDDRRNQAATKVQAGAKGYLARKKYKADKALRQQQQAEQEREAAARREGDRQKKAMNEHDAATKIQAGFRGYESRKNMKQKKVRDHTNKLEKDKLEKENRAASKIQSGFRGHKARKEYRYKKEELKKSKVEQSETVKDVNDNEKDSEKQHHAATKIQSGFRGHIARKEMKNRKLENEAKTVNKRKEINEDEAANTIQAGFKGYKQRKEYSKMKQEKQAQKAELKAKEDKAASLIQAGARGHMARKSYKQKKVAKEENDKKQREQNEAASRIQAGFKGYATRKKNAERKNETQLPDSSPRKTAEEDLDAAATKIQKNYRGFAARKELKAKQVTNPYDGESDIDQLPDSAVSRHTLRKGQFIPGSKDDNASKIQIAFRGYRARKVFIDRETLNVKLAERKIIAAYKGYLTRKQQHWESSAERSEKESIVSEHSEIYSENYVEVCSCENESIASEEPKIYPNHAVEIICAAFQGYIARKVHQKRMRSYARVVSVEGSWYYATIIQALCKGYMTRHQIEMKPDTPKPQSPVSIQGPTKSDNAIEIENQSDSQKSYWEDTNVKMYSDKTLRQAAAKIQSAYHMLQTRKSHKAWKAKLHQQQQQQQFLYTDDDKIEAAIKIQSFYRDHRQRKMFEVERNGKAVYDDDAGKSEGNKNIEVVHSDINQNDKVSENDIHEYSKPKNNSPVRSRPTSGQRSKTPSETKVTGSRPGSRKRKREHSMRKNSGKSRPGSSSSEIPKVVDATDILDISAISKEPSIESIDTKNSKGTIRVIEKVKRRSAGEVEKEGVSPREIEDDEGELSSIEKSVSNVSQLQAAFRAYKMRREVSELLSGGEELVDIKKINSAVSALKKDFRLRSAKVRRLGSYQFSPGRDKNSGGDQQWWEAENQDESWDNGGMDKTMQAGDINISSSTDNSQDRGTDRNTSLNTSQTAETTKKTDNFRNEVASLIQTAVRGYNARREFRRSSFRKKQSDNRIRAAFCGYRTRMTEQQRLLKEKERKKVSEKESANLKIEAAFRGYRTRETEMKRKREKAIHEEAAMKARKHEANSVIEAAYRGYRTRTTEIQVRNKSRQSGRSLHVEMHSDIINERATQLQAAFAGYQTRSIFISLSKLVEQDHDNSMNASSGNLERMGSLSETDDFKLRHKSIAKMQAVFGEHKSSLENKTVPEEAISSGDSKKDTLKGNVDQFDKSQNVETTGMSRIQTYIGRMSAATVIQSHAKSYLVRKEFAEKLKMNSKNDKSSVTGHSRRNSKDSSKDYPNWAKEEMKVRTTSVKLEAEKRKVIAEQNRLSQEVTKAKENTATVKKQAEKLKAEMRKASISDDSINIPDSKTGAREHDSAVKIQKVYRGHRVRRQLESANNLRMYENEYEEWKHKRIDAAVAIQSGWRGYMVRKEMREKDGSPDGEEFDSFPSGMIVINIGRTKSEIARAEKRYENASLIQMVWQASHVRRQMKVKMAVRRHEKSHAANKIQSWYRGNLARQNHRKMKSATRIQSILKAYLARLRMKEEKLRRQQKAATFLQSVYRSYSKRKEVEADKEARRKIAEMHEAAKAIQSGLRGLLVRKDLGERKDMLQATAATKIQAGMKGYIERKKAKERRSALLIWSAFKGYKERYVFSQKRNASALIVAASKALKQRQKVRVMKASASLIRSAYKSYSLRKTVRGKKEAAKVIASAYWSYKQRLQMRLFKEKKHRERIAATKIQSAYKGNKMRHETKVYRDIMILENKCASYIQLCVRGRQARIDYKKLKIEREQKRKAAALKIQSVYRGHKGRVVARRRRHIRDMNNDAKHIIDLILHRAFDYLDRRSDSADRITASYKGFCSRKTMMDRLSDEAKLRAKERHASATCIQSVVRAKQVRDKLAAKKELENQNRAAVKIQSLFRGHSERKHIARERALIASIKPPVTDTRTRSGRQLELRFDEVLMGNARAIIQFHKKATELQDAFRAYKMRREVMNRFDIKMKLSQTTPRRPSKELWGDEDRAAVRIQKTFRGYRQRNKYLKEIVPKREIWRKCASQIQASLRGYFLREEARKIKLVKLREGSAELRRKRHHAANLIACAFRALKSKQVSIASRAEM